MSLSPQRLAEWRSRPERVAIRRWENRTYAAARTELAHRHPGEFLEILDRVRERDPRPTGEERRHAA